MIATLSPFHSVGDFVLDTDINNYKSKYLFEIEDYSTDLYVPSVHFSISNPELTLFVENDKIIEIGCYEELLYKGRNLIGMKIEEFISHTGENYVGEVDCLDFEEDDIPQYVYEFETIGLQVWVKGQQRKIVTIIVSVPFEKQLTNE